MKGGDASLFVSNEKAALCFRPHSWKYIAAPSKHYLIRLSNVDLRAVCRHMLI